MEEQIRKAVSEALAKMGAGGIDFVLERPADFAYGDYTTNAALTAQKFLKKPPLEIAAELANVLQPMLAGIATEIQIKIAKPGFINLTLSRDTISALVAEADAKREEWGKGSAESGKRVMIEFTDPNPFKEMHIGHLMSNIIGESLARSISNEGAHVIRASYQGDIGPHVAKALWGLRQAGITEPTTAKELGEAYARGARAYEESMEAKAEIDALNLALYNKSNAELIELWRKGRDVSLAAFEDVYRILGTTFDYYFFESETSESGARIVRDGLNKAVFEEGEGGAIIYPGEKKGLHTLVFITSKGTPTYEAKDMGLAFLKEERAEFDQSIIVTAAEQIGHFKVFLAALAEMAPTLAAKTMHVPHGFLRLTSGKMSSREGTVVTAADFIRNVLQKVNEKNDDPLIAEQVAVGAIKYMVLRQAPGSDIIFDEEKSLSLEGDSGPYLQYALVRAKSVVAKASGNEKTKAASAEPTRLERIMLHFPEVAARAARELAPNLLVNYLTELASEWNSFYAQERIIGSADESHKLLIARAFIQTMQNGLTLLGIPTPEKM